MSFLSGGAKKQAQQQPNYTGLDIQTSAAGKALAIAVGTIRLAPNIMWYGDFESHKHESSSGGAGKGGNSGASGSVTYTYSASVIMGLCEGPVNGIGTVWVGKAVTSMSKLGMSFFAGTYPQAPWGYLSSKYGAIAESRTIPASAPYQLLADESASFLDDDGVGVSLSLSLTKTSGTPAAYQYQQSGDVYTFNAANAGSSVVISYQTSSFQFGAGQLVAQVVTATIPSSAPHQVSVSGLSVDKGVTISRHSLDFVTGTPGPAQYSVTSGGLYTFNAANARQPVTLNYTAFSVDSQALNYNGIAYIAVANYDLGDSPDLSNHNFEVHGFYSNSVSGSVAADPSLFITDYLTSPHWGVGFPSSRLGDVTTYQNYALAAGLLVSFSLDQQQTASQILADLMTATNSEFVWSEGSLSIVSYGDETITGNGKTYTPPSEPLFDLTDDDYVIESAGDDPVLLTRTRPADAYNDVQVEYLDRTNAYNTAIAEATDQAGVDSYGLRTVSGSGTHIFADGACAKISAQLQLQRQAIRNTYTFTTDERYIALDPMDIVTITDAYLGLDQQWVRITQVELNDDGTLTFTAEEYLDGTGHAAEYSFQGSGGFITDYNVDPGDTNVPVIFEAPGQIATTGGLEVWMVASGGTEYGGADIYISQDGDSYKYAGTALGQGRQGILTADLPVGTDPDLANIAYVDLSESGGELLSGTQADADLGNTLCYIGGELVSYETATLTDVTAYALTYLRRGMYGTTSEDHAPGTQFARIDQGKFVYGYDKTQIGQTIYIKLLAFNHYMGGNQSLADVEPYTHLLTGPPKPEDVRNFLVVQNGNAVNFTWSQVDDFVLKGYDIGYAPEGTTEWSEFSLLTEASKGTEMTNAAVPAGTWTFGIRARDIADQLSPDISTFDLVVMNNNDTTTIQVQEPEFAGSMSGFVRHWTGVLVPESTSLANAYSDYTIFNNFVSDPVSSASYITPTYDIGFEDDLRIHTAYSLTEGPGQSGTPVADIQLDAWTTGSDPDVYVDWTVGTIDVRYLNMKIIYAPTAGAVAYLSDFTYTVDRSPILEQSESVTIAAGGTIITFPAPFHDIPTVIPTVISGSALYATASSITTNGCTINIWNSSGTSVGGTSSYSAKGI